MIPAFVGLLLFATSVIRPTFVVEPGYPPNAVGGGSVVAELRLTPGTDPDVRILSGTGVFAESAKSALQQWRFTTDRKTSVIVVVRFRDPNFYSTGSAAKEVETGAAEPSLPFPAEIVEPPYPANALGQGSVIIRADVSASGTVTATEVIKEAGGLTSASEDAVKGWRFLPARDTQGGVKCSSVFAVLVFRIPVTAPVRPPAPGTDHAY